MNDKPYNKLLTLSLVMIILTAGYWFVDKNFLNCENCLARTLIDKGEEKTMETDFLLVDVRTPEEYAAGFMPGAINIPMDDILAGNLGEIAEIDSGTQIRLYCNSGRRAAVVMEALSQSGYTNLKNLHDEDVN
jgi:phage shock protein E